MAMAQGATDAASASGAATNRASHRAGASPFASRARRVTTQELVVEAGAHCNTT